MDITLVKQALGIEDSASDSEVLGRIQELRSAAGDSEYLKDSPDVQLLKAGQHPQCCINVDGSVTVTLLEPIPAGKDSITEMTLRRPKMKDLKAAQEKSGNGMAYAAMLIHLLSGQAMNRVVDELDAEDAGVLSHVVNFLSQGRRATGA